MVAMKGRERVTDSHSKSSLHERSIIKNSKGLPQDTKHLRSCFVIKYHSQYVKVIGLLQHSLTKS